MPSSAPRRRTFRAAGAAYVVVSLLITAMLFFVVEGMASFARVAARALKPQMPLAKQRYTRYDPQLGWVSLPNVYIRDMYGPGAYLRTNSRGFRADTDTSAAVPPGKIRVICSGDSFTLGYGVANDRTWCHDLASLDDRIETVNMGQGGYGVDQAYLWYARDGIRLDHDVQIFAFIGTDLRRMASATFEGYPKPILALDGGRLVTRNVPVQQVGASGRLVQRLMAFRDLQSVALAQQFLFRRTPPDGGLTPAVFDITRRVFDRLQELNRNKNSELIVAFLPTEGEYRQGMPPYIERLKRDVIAKGIAWVDLVDDFRKLPPEQAARLFLTAADIPQYKSAEGHYTNQGNALVAQLLYRKMTAIPSVANRLTGLNATR